MIALEKLVVKWVQNPLANSMGGDGYGCKADLNKIYYQLYWLTIYYLVKNGLYRIIYFNNLISRNNFQWGFKEIVLHSNTIWLRKPLLPPR